jgi:dTDP-4-amino-4,6-dideoxygalactose transaminase
MSEYGELAQKTVEFLGPCLAAAGGKLVEDGMNAAREKVFDWLKSKFKKPAQSAALELAAKAPEDAESLAALQFQIERALEQQEEFRKELLERLPKEIVPAGVAQTLNVTGDNNVAGQFSGSGNSMNVQR